MKYKMFVADFDDTILGSNREIGAKFVTAIHKYIENGGRFVLATGRATSSIMPFCKQMNLSGELISYQGSIISDIKSGKVLKRMSIEHNLLIKILEHLNNKGLCHHIYIDDGVVAEKESPFTQKYITLSGLTCIEAHMPLFKYATDKGLDSTKVLIVSNEEDAKTIRDELKKEFGHVTNVFTSKPWLVEIIPLNSGKGEALKFIAEKYSVDLKDIAAVGDGENDVEMLKLASFSAAVENACQEAKDVANIIVPSNDNDGVAYLLENYIL